MLLNACMSAAPGQKECDNALRNIQVRLAQKSLNNGVYLRLAGGLP